VDERGSVGIKQKGKWEARKSVPRDIISLPLIFSLFFSLFVIIFSLFVDFLEGRHTTLGKVTFLLNG
jgi:hypothetical protein